jgi:hypothetical protein
MLVSRCSKKSGHTRSDQLGESPWGRASWFLPVPVRQPAWQQEVPAWVEPAVSGGPLDVVRLLESRPLQLPQVLGFDHQLFLELLQEIANLGRPACGPHLMPRRSLIHTKQDL